MNQEILLHTRKIQKYIAESEAGGLLVSSNANIYYTALRFFRGYVYIPLDGDPIFFIVRPLGLAEVFPGAVQIRKPEEIPDKLAEKGIKLADKIGFEFDTMTYSDIMRLTKALNPSEAVNGSSWLRRARMVKTPEEIKLMEYDGIHQTEAYRHFTKVYREDMTDVEFQIELERILRLEGCLGYSRVSGSLMEINLGSVINGDNADVPTPYEFAMGGEGVDPALPGGANGKVMKPGTTVMVDMSGAFNGYQTDLTRVWKIGDIPELAEKAHKCSIRILHTLERMAVPGVPCAELYNCAISIVEEEGLSDYFMGHRQKAAFIGHGVGIELNEMPVLTPRSKDILEENMTIAIEPKFVIPGVGAVGPENTYQVTPKGLRNLTPLNEELIDLQ